MDEQERERLREALAALAHEQWSGWMRYLFEKTRPLTTITAGGPAEGGVLLPQWAVERWQRQVDTPYADLPAGEKESDRQEADRVLAVIAAHPPTPPDAADDIDDLVDRYAVALKAKLRLARERGKAGWERDDWMESCQQQLIAHLAKGDPLDIGAYSAFMWHHGWPTVAPTPPAAAARGDGGLVADAAARLMELWQTERYWTQDLPENMQEAADVLAAALRAPTTTPAHPGGAETAAEGGAE